MGVLVIEPDFSDTQSPYLAGTAAGEHGQDRHPEMHPIKTMTPRGMNIGRTHAPGEPWMMNQWLKLVHRERSLVRHLLFRHGPRKAPSIDLCGRVRARKIIGCDGVVDRSAKQANFFLQRAR